MVDWQPPVAFLLLVGEQVFEERLQLAPEIKKTTIAN
jgi:hypothetical protein